MFGAPTAVSVSRRPISNELAETATRIREVWRVTA